MDLKALEQRLGYTFAATELLQQAVTHRSHGAVHNERLEFLGDAVLNCTIAQLLFQKYVRFDEGDLSRLRANLVKQSSLAEIAERIALSEFMRLGEGERKSGGFRRPSILADTIEAIFGAVLVDGGFDAARDVITRLFDPVIKVIDPKTLGKDSKTLLQEYLQGKRLPLPVYTVVETRGAAHNQEFEVECAIPKLDISVRGNGRSRRAAEQSAANLAFEAAHAALQTQRRSRRKPEALDVVKVDAKADAKTEVKASTEKLPEKNETATAQVSEASSSATPNAATSAVSTSAPPSSTAQPVASSSPSSR